MEALKTQLSELLFSSSPDEIISLMIDLSDWLRHAGANSINDLTEKGAILLGDYLS